MDQDGAVDAPIDTATCQAKDAGDIQTNYPLPTATSIQFAALHAMPPGEQILFNDWNAQPNTVSSLTPDGMTATTLFQAYRVWSMGVSHDKKTIAFSCGDPNQQTDFGLQIGDSIQETWLYDVATQSVKLLAHGNINDECHTFGPQDSILWVCRRYDFAETPATDDAGGVDGTNKGYRVGRIDLATGLFDFITDDDPMTSTLMPQPTPDGTSLLYSSQHATSATKTTDSIVSLPLGCGSPSTARSNAYSPTLSPDGTRYTYNDATAAGALYASSLDGASTVKLTSENGTGVAWSPDGSRVAYLVYDNASSCQNIHVVKTDGSQASSPTTLRACATTKEFITQLAWVP
ncbi:MAG TPA: hypothetical protein VIF62_23235 [Labilithrix sp.]